MLAVSGQPPDDAGWAVEMKWDGVRAIVVCDGDGCRLYSRNRRDITGTYPELIDTLTKRAGGRELVLDGEIIAQTPEGTPSFALLQHRMHVIRPARRLLDTVPVRLFLFDLLSQAGETLTNAPYLQRRDRLAALGFAAGPVQTPPHWLGVGAAQLLGAARENRLEGIVSKQIDSVYRPGRRSPDWIKTPLRETIEAIVAGWTTGNGALGPTFGSLILAAYDSAGALVHIGNVGTGFSAADRRVLRARLDTIARERSPLARVLPRLGTAHWVEPVLVGDIEFREFTGDGLRHPSWRGLRADKSPAEVTMPPATR